MIKKMLDPVHPGEVLLEEFLKPMGLSQNQLALSLGVHARKINEIVLGKRRVTAAAAETGAWRQRSDMRGRFDRNLTACGQLSTVRPTCSSRLVRGPRR